MHDLTFAHNLSFSPSFSLASSLSTYSSAAAGFGAHCKRRGIPVVEFNIEDTGSACDHRILGPSSITLPQILALENLE
jgi:hypothetical protein